VAYAAGSGVALLAWDIPRALGALQAPCERSNAIGRWTRVRSLIGRALPLGVSSAVGNVQSNLPRYAIAWLLGPAPLAVFAAISHLPLLGHLAVNAASQAALPLLARDTTAARRSYQVRLQGLIAASLGFGAVALVVTMVAGKSVLTAIYGSEYADHVSVLYWLMTTAVITFTTVFLGAGTTARGRFGAQLAISTTSLVIVATSIGPLVRNFGLNGAAYSLLAGAIVELGAYTVLTLRDFRREPPTPTLVPNALAGGVQP
jgi:O-antigen/teichoic acid export membrane protein